MTLQNVRPLHLLQVLIGVAALLAAQAHAQTAAVTEPANDPAIAAAASDHSEPDWSLLDSYNAALTATPASAHKSQTAAPADYGLAWSSHDNADGSEALSVKQPILPFWDAQIGADMTLAREAAPRTAADLLRSEIMGDGGPTQSTGAAWATMTAPGVGVLWDKTAIQARLDPSQDQRMLGTSFSKSVPLAGKAYALTLQNSASVVEPGIAPMIAPDGHLARSLDIGQTAKFDIAGTGTSLLAGQSFSSTDARWLRSVGVEQKLSGGLSITGSLAQTLDGRPNASLTAGFKRSW